MKSLWVYPLVVAVILVCGYVCSLSLLFVFVCVSHALLVSLGCEGPTSRMFCVSVVMNVRVYVCVYVYVCVLCDEWVRVFLCVVVNVHMYMCVL